MSTPAHQWSKWDPNAMVRSCTVCGEQQSVIAASMLAASGVKAPCPGPKPAPGPALNAPAPTAPAIPAWALNATLANHSQRHILRKGNHAWLLDPTGPAAGGPTMGSGAICADCREYAPSASHRAMAPVLCAPSPSTLHVAARMHLPFPSGSTMTYGSATAHMDPLTPEQQAFWGLDKPAPSTTTKAKCPDCDRELSSTLDVYYGRDPYLACRCVDCRAEVES